MKVFEYDSDIQPVCTYIADAPQNIMYFDIETTGLSPQRSDLYMIGMAYACGEKFKTLLLFNDDGMSEPEMLARFAKLLSSHSVIVTYNGDTFDIPYMKTKLAQFDVDSDISAARSVDIYKIVRRYKKLLGLASARQVDTEELVGFHRHGFVPGGDLISVYKEFLTAKRNGSPDVSELTDVLTMHNLDDIRGLIAVSGLAALPHLLSGISVKAIGTGKSDEDGVITYICTIPELPCRLTYSNGCVSINAKGSDLTIRIQKTHGIKKMFFDDYKNYYYLPAEDMAIHRSMASYVDKGYREKATKQTAYVNREADFVPAPKGFQGKIFHDSEPDGAGFSELTGSLKEPGEDVRSYLQGILSDAGFEP